MEDERCLPLQSIELGAANNTFIENSNTSKCNANGPQNQLNLAVICSPFSPGGPGGPSRMAVGRSPDTEDDIIIKFCQWDFAKLHIVPYNSE